MVRSVFMFGRPDWRLLLRAASLVLGGAVVGLGVNLVRPSGVALLSFDPPTTCSLSNPYDGDVLEIGVREAAILCSSAGVVFADTRSAERFAEGHVANAVHLPCDATENVAAESLRKVMSAPTVVVYGETSDDGRNVVATLRKRGVPGELRVLAGGFRQWEREGLACASGPCSECSVAGSREPGR